MIHLLQGSTRPVPDWFASQLRALDPNLIVYFNQPRQRWVIDRCTRGGAMNAALHEHTPECPRTNVMIVRDGTEYKPLCDAVLEELRGMDSWRFGSVEEYQRHNDAVLAADQADRQRKVDDAFHEASKDNRRQLLKAYDLTQIHDVHRVNQ